MGKTESRLLKSSEWPQKRPIMLDPNRRRFYSTSGVLQESS